MLDIEMDDLHAKVKCETNKLIVLTTSTNEKFIDYTVKPCRGMRMTLAGRIDNYT